MSCVFVKRKELEKINTHSSKNSINLYILLYYCSLYVYVALIVGYQFSRGKSLTLIDFKRLNSCTYQTNRILSSQYVLPLIQALCRYIKNTEKGKVKKCDIFSGGMGYGLYADDPGKSWISLQNKNCPVLAL